MGEKEKGHARKRESRQSTEEEISKFHVLAVTLPKMLKCG
jgi:hypothetical protein